MPKRSTQNRCIEVILLQSDKHLGEKHEIVKVKPNFARNVLLPQNIAILADDNNKNSFKQKIKAGEEERKRKAQNLEELFSKIHSDGGLTFIKKANKDGGLYDKLDEHEITNQIKELYGLQIDSHLFKLKKKLSKLGQFTIPFLYKDLKKEINITIQQDAEELKKQSKQETKSETTQDNQDTPTKSKEELKAEKEEKRKIEKAEKIKQLKEKYK